MYSTWRSEEPRGYCDLSFLVLDCGKLPLAVAGLEVFRRTLRGDCRLAEPCEFCFGREGLFERVCEMIEPAVEETERGRSRRVLAVVGRRGRLVAMIPEKQFAGSNNQQIIVAQCFIQHRRWHKST